MPGKGIDLIQFGATEQQAAAILGVPDKVYYTEFGCKRLQFNTYRIELSFEPENDFRLGWIEVHNPAATLCGKRIVGCTKSEVIEFVSGYLEEQPVIEDYGSFVSVAFDESWVEVQYQFGLVQSIHIGVRYDSLDEPCWPCP